MIQRIQSIYMVLVALISGGLIFVFSLWTDAEANRYALDLLKAEAIELQLIPVLFLLSAVLVLIAIFLFKNRKRQFVLNRITILVNLFLLGLLLYYLLNLPGEVAISKKGIGVFLPVVNVLLLVLANKAIQKDENLVKSVDRLR